MIFKKNKICRKILPIIFGLLVANGAMANSDYEINVLPTVTVTDSYIVDFDYWGGYNPSWDPFPFFLSAQHGWMEQFSGTHEEGARLAQLSYLGRQSSVCIAIVSNDAKSTTASSDVTTRWLAAQEVFNFMNSQNLLLQWRDVLGNVVFKIDGKIYNGFRVSYADGSDETWAVNPGYKTSSIKLLDQPMPNSLNHSLPHQNTPRCNVG